MSCDSVWLFRNVTLWPTAIVTCDGLTAPLLLMVMVAPTAPTAFVEPTFTEPDPDPEPGEVGELPPHAAAVISAATVKVCTTSIRVPRVTVSSRSRDQSSEEFPRDVEADVPIVVIRGAGAELSERRAEPVRDVQLKQMSAGSPFETETDLAHPRVVPAKAW